MRRRRKIDEENQPEIIENTGDFNDFPAEDESDGENLIPPRPIARQRHRIVTEFEEQVPADELGTRPQHIVAASEPDTIETELPPHIAAFLEMAGGSSDRWQLKVWRLPRYEVDARTNMQNRMFCGLLDLAPNYEEEIQRRWARPGISNYFYAMVVKNGLFVKDGVLPVISCEPLPGSELPAPAAAPAAPGYPPQTYIIENETAAPPSLKNQLRELVELKRLFRELEPPPAAPAPAASATSDEAALLGLLSRETDLIDRVSKGALGRLLGETREEVTPWDVLMETVKSGQAPQIIGTAIQSLGNVVRSMMPPPQPVVVPPSAPLDAQPTPSDPPAAMIDAAQLSPEDRALQLMVNHCLRNAPVKVAGARLLALADQINEHMPEASIDEYLQMFCAMEPDAAIALAAQLTPNGHELQSLSYAREWVVALQLLIQSEMMEAGE